MQYRSLVGQEGLPFVQELANLRIQVFSEYPYLYEGSLAYEEHYLEWYYSCPKSLVILALHEGQVVGATTGLPLWQAAQEWQAPFKEHNLPLEDYFYFGESVLLAKYRGQGIGKEFFKQREAYAKSLGQVRFTTFCAVRREDNHPMRPPSYRSLEPFWQSLGYRQHPQLTSTFHWTDLGDTKPSEKIMGFWIKTLQ